MVNEEKIKLMTKLATYEQGEGKDTLPVMQYFQSDYIIYHVIRADISATLAYAVILGIVCAVKGQYLLENINTIGIAHLAVWVLLGYVLMLAVYITAALIIYMRRYEKAKHSVKRYYHWLKQLDLFYKN